MKFKISHLFLILSVLFFSITFSSCDTSQVPTLPDIIPLPAFTDNIPYSVLGSGKIAFERIGRQKNSNYFGIILVDIDKATVETLSGVISFPALSPNGDKIAFSAQSSLSFSYDIFVMSIDGTVWDNISTTPEDDLYPAWSPDQQKIYFYNSPIYTNGVQHLIVQSPYSGASDRQYLPDDNYPMGPISISSDKIVYYGNLSPSGIYTTDLDGNNPNLILAKPSNRYLESPCFSPDGNSIAYLSVDRDSTKLYHSVEVKIMNVDGSSPKSIIAVPAGGNTEFSNADQINNVTVCWSPDGKKLLFNVPEDNQVSHIYVVNVDGTGLTKITSLSGITDRKVTWSK